MQNAKCRLGFGRDINSIHVIEQPTMLKVTFLISGFAGRDGKAREQLEEVWYCNTTAPNRVSPICG